MFKKKSVKQKIGLVLLVVVFVCTIVAAYLVNTNVLPYALLVPQTFSPQALKEDFLFLRKTLEEGHPGLYRYTSKAEMDRLFDETQQKLNHSMDEIAFYRILAPLIAAIKDGHTSLEPATILSDQLSPQNDFPLSVRVLGNKVFIFDDFATPDHALAGAEILSINGVPIETILHTMLAGITGDGNIITGKVHYLEGGGALGYFRALFSPMLYPLLGITSPFTLKYRPYQQVQERTIQVSGRPFDDLVKAYEKKYPADARPPLLPDGRIMPPNEPSFLDHGNIAVWKFSGFGGYTPADRNGAYIDTAFQQIRAHRSKVLILDVRNVGGGLDALGERLYSYFADAPFRYYDDLVANALTFSFLSQTQQAPPLPADEFARGADGKYHWVKHLMGLMQPLQPYFAGKVYLLINGDCFSACAEVASSMQFHKKATFIGEEVGGGYYGNTSGIPYDVYLSHTKIVLVLPVVAYYLSVRGYPSADQGVMPDYPVQSTIQDLLAGKDNEMTMALSIARGEPLEVSLCRYQELEESLFAGVNRRLGAVPQTQGVYHPRVRAIGNGSTCRLARAEVAFELPHAWIAEIP
jgi:hypothetical protein